MAVNDKNRNTIIDGILNQVSEVLKTECLKYGFYTQICRV